MRFLVTGGAGFIGSNLAKKLLKEGYNVSIFDKTPLNQAKRLESIVDKISYTELDIQDLDNLKNELKNYDVVAHFSASADIALGESRTDIDLKNGIIATYNVLESMRINNIKKIIFPSSSTVYGDFSKIPTPEDAGMLFPKSLYGAAKLSCEGLISAFCHLFKMNSWIFRFGNVVGPDMARGVIKDFIKKIQSDPTKLEILGDGNQQKDFIHIEDCTEGMLFAFKKACDVVNVFNLSTGTTTSVNKIADMVIEQLNLKNVKRTYTGGKSGWPGDAPIVHYNISKIKKLGWSPKFFSDDAVKRAIIETLEREVVS